MTHATSPAALPTFWRDDALPFVEARAIADGRKVRYGRHAHSTFSIGAVTGGHSTYLNGRALEHIGAGAVVVINPDTVHACNPAESAPWAYRMFYVDVDWLASLQHETAEADSGAHREFRPFRTTWTMRADLFAGLNQLHALLTAPDARTDTLRGHGATIGYFSTLLRALNPEPSPRSEPNHRLARAAEYIDDNYTHALKLDDICAAANLSASYLVRAFKARYGMTPHAYMVNRRIEFSRAQLRRGHAIADVAAEAGFADQAHLQRAFRQFVAATPGQYRG
ncbi:helix-turn-helix transcriptional regulator [Paraburkholderia caballeronis]|uniref:AraC-type DNA-binding protein n=1 Tax=Paraburkholderia caballeronis TaxID=416943 RepID=A0A1H7VN25_9BURK|nr:AraC family transcriptional regulator [Paraburkholderia caballeronis]PXW14982.1 AraC family transcriptional regulator [Paraburkholderia caballeronis]PXW93615.1 AraC family transcriptional regulator [Paraburkholderia caballeronis]RAJ88946.1 AraC family transcriptional regulator [Paraburkholderia caballeronis]SED95324.1 transcriptional regulator, AraC family [Paraburkholderia caballeronis]SEM10245.1 AraC-type DNA-binding protein [Paraburkholderia caballeronis]